MNRTIRKVLLVDDDPVVGKLVHKLLSRRGCMVESVTTGAAALSAIDAGFDGVIVLDLRLPDMDGQTVFEELRRRAPACPVIFLTGYGSTDLALDAIVEGAHEFIDKATLLDRLPRAVESAFRTIEPADGDQPGGTFAEFVADSREMHALFRSLRNALTSNVSVLIHGESGTGKELVARAIHHQGANADGPFIAINCAGIPEPLLEAELFGYERGAFTGAVARKIGKFEAARGGTLMLDEIGEMHPMLQAKLLRVLQEGELQRLGGNATIKTDVRIVSATNRDLEQEIEEGRFRADLYYRLAVYSVFVPPLRDRTGDVPLLVDHFVKRFAKREGKQVSSVNKRALDLFEVYDYPGNVRELENAVSYAVVSSRGPQLNMADLPPSFLRSVARYRKKLGEEEAAAPETEGSHPGKTDDPVPRTADNFPTMAEMERRHVEAALGLAAGNKTAAAGLLGVSRMTLYRKLAEYDLGETD